MSVISNMKKYFLRSLITEKVCHYLSGDIGGEGIMKKVTNCDIGEGESKILHFHCDVIFKWSQANVLKTLLSMG